MPIVIEDIVAYLLRNGIEDGKFFNICIYINL